MSKPRKTIKVRAVLHPKVCGKYKAPGTVFDCPTEFVDGLLALKAIEFVRPPAVGSEAEKVAEGGTPEKEE